MFILGKICEVKFKLIKYFVVLKILKHKECKDYFHDPIQLLLLLKQRGIDAQMLF